MDYYIQIRQTAMKTLTQIKIGIITLLVVLSNVSFGNNSPVKEVKVSTTKSTTVKTNKSQDLVGSKRGILPPVTITVSSRTYLV
ncbi:MAG: hypothetical protein ABIP51_00080 [Bacteroidia bacterium]